MYDDEKAFLKVLMAHFGLSDRGTRAGVIIFAHEAGLVIKLGDHDDSLSFNSAVDKITLIGTYSRIDKALRLSQKELFAKENGARHGVPKVLESDGGPPFNGQEFRDFCKKWNIMHRKSSAGWAQSNGRAELQLACRCISTDIKSLKF